MKKFLALMLVAVLCLIPVATFAAGTIVRTASDAVDGQSVTLLTYTMTGDAADGSFPAVQAGPIDGWIITVETNPGSTAPTALWDLTLVDTDGADVMAGTLANRSATATERVISPQPYVRGPVTITATNSSVNSSVIVLKITVLR